MRKLVLALALVTLPSVAHAELLQRCQVDDLPIVKDRNGSIITPNSDSDKKQVCDAINHSLTEWENRLSQIQNNASSMTDAANAQDWKTYREKWSDALPVMQQFLDAAKQDKTDETARNIERMNGRDLADFVTGVGLPVPANIAEAGKSIDAHLDQNTATAGQSILRQFYQRGLEFAPDAAKLDALPAIDSLKKQQETETEIRHDEMHGTSVSGYFSGFWGRVRDSLVSFGIIAFLGCAIIGFFSKGKPGPAMRSLVASAALPLLISILISIFLPFLPEWIISGTLLFGTLIIFFFVHPLNLIAEKWGKGERKTESSPSAHEAEKLRSDADTHGSARWGNVQDMAKYKHIGTPDLALARIPNAPSQIDPRFRYNGHVVTVAPTRSGKGIGAVIPNLLEYPGSCIVLDVKGENAAVTARARRQMGQDVFILDPFKVMGKEVETHRFNPLDTLNVLSPDCIGDALLIADAMMARDKAPEGASAHFEETARSFLQGVILHVACLPDRARRNLGEVRRLLTLPEQGEEDFIGLVGAMADADHLAFGIPARAANALMSTPDKERGSILSTVRRITAFLDDPRICAAMTDSDFRLSELKAKPMTVYLVIPANRIAPNAGFVRLFLNSTLAAITASTVVPKHKVLCLLDEFGQLGYMKPIEDAVSLLSGYGLTFWIFLQELSQIKAVYPRWQTFLANSAQVFFGTKDPDTAEYISKTLGSMTIEYATNSESENEGSSSSIARPVGGSSSSRGSSTSQSQQLTGRALLTLDEVLGLGPLRPIVLIGGERPYLLQRLNYLTDPEYQGKFDKNPYHV